MLSYIPTLQTFFFIKKKSLFQWTFGIIHQNKDSSMIRNECNVMFAVKNFISPLKTDLWLSLETNRWPIWLNAALLVSKARGIRSTKQEKRFL